MRYTRAGYFERAAGGVFSCSVKREGGDFGADPRGRGVLSLSAPLRAFSRLSGREKSPRF